MSFAGSLIKLVYYSRGSGLSALDKNCCSSKENVRISDGDGCYPLLGGRLHFQKFETSKVDDCIEFIRSKQVDFGGKLLAVFNLWTRTEKSTAYYQFYMVFG